jgi:hypothetical protein
MEVYKRFETINFYNMKIKNLATLLVLALSMSAWAQGVGVNETGNDPDPSAILDVESTDKGFLAPRMTEAQRDAITDPATGLIIYNTDETCLQVNNGTPAAPVWVCMGAAPANSLITVVGSTPTYTGQNVIIDNNTGNHLITLPNPASPLYANTLLYYRNNSAAAGGAGTATFTTYTPVNNPTCLANRGQTFYSDGTNWYLVGGF